MTYQASVRLRFSAGHRLPNHGGKCRYPHGHSYLAEFLLGADTLGAEDWIIDFGDVKDLARAFIEEHFDHAFLVDSRDTTLIEALRQVEPLKLYIFDSAAPTAEKIAEELFRRLKPDISSLTSVRVWETEQQYGEFGSPSTA